MLLLGRNQAQMTVFAKHPPIQGMAPMFIRIRRELDGTDLQKTTNTNIYIDTVYIHKVGAITYH